MKKTLMSVGLLALCFVIMSAFAMAAPVQCSTLIGQDVDPGGTGNSITCTAGGLTFSNFYYTVVGMTPGSSQPAAIDLGGVSPPGGFCPASEICLNFNPNLGTNGITGITDLHLAFEVSGGVYGADLTNNGSLDPIEENNCSAGVVGDTTGDCPISGSNPPLGTELWNATVQGGGFASCGPNDALGGSGTNPGPPPICNYGSSPNVWVFKDLSVATSNSVGNITAGNPNGVIINPLAHDSSFTESFIVPEPMTLSLLGAGLLGLGLLRKRMRK